MCWFCGIRARGGDGRQRYARVPVVNAGDGSHEHPTQTLCDLYSLRVEKGGIEGLDVVLCGDLKYSRTIHSFAYALARFGANLVCAPQPGFEMPDYVIERLRERYRVEPHRVEVQDLGSVAPNMDAMYFTPERPHQLSLFTDIREVNVKKFDALYVTRPQRRALHRGGEGGARLVFPRRSVGARGSQVSRDGRPPSAPARRRARLRPR